MKKKPKKIEIDYIKQDERREILTLIYEFFHMLWHIFDD
jgi:hypothetical protein